MDKNQLLALRNELLRYGVLLLTAPLWLPFVKTLWKELQRVLRWEGGLFGKRPDARQLAEIDRATTYDEDPLVNEPLAGRGERSSFRANPQRTGGRTTARGPAGRALPRGPQRGPPRGGANRRPGGGFR